MTTRLKKKRCVAQHIWAARPTPKQWACFVIGRPSRLEDSSIRAAWNDQSMVKAGRASAKAMINRYQILGQIMISWQSIYYLPKTNQHERNCYKVDGYKSNHYRKHCSRIIHSVRKFVLATVFDEWTRQELQQKSSQGRKVLAENKAAKKRGTCSA